jgi:hypothetical protein
MKQSERRERGNENREREIGEESGPVCWFKLLLDKVAGAGADGRDPTQPSVNA